MLKEQATFHAQGTVIEDPEQKEAGVACDANDVLSSGPSEVAANSNTDGKLDKNLEQQTPLVQSESFAPSLQLLPNDVTQTDLKNDAGVAG